MYSSISMYPTSPGTIIYNLYSAHSTKYVRVDYHLELAIEYQMYNVIGIYDIYRIRYLSCFPSSTSYELQ
jgi:hypothetical protein